MRAKEGEPVMLRLLEVQVLAEQVSESHYHQTYVLLSDAQAYVCKEEDGVQVEVFIHHSLY